MDQKDQVSGSNTPPTGPNTTTNSPNKNSKDKTAKIDNVQVSSSKSFVDEEKSEILDNPKDSKDSRKRLQQLRDIYNTIKQQLDQKLGKLSFKEQALERFKRRIETLTATLTAITMEISYLSEQNTSTNSRQSFAMESPRLGAKQSTMEKSSPILLGRVPTSPSSQPPLLPGPSDTSV